MASTGGRASKSSLFLIELIITIFFFSLAGVTCMRLFTYAHSVSGDSVNTTQAVRIAQNAAESFLAARGDTGVFEELIGMWLQKAEPAAGEAAPGRYTALFDDGWRCTALKKGEEKTASPANYTAELKLNNMDAPEGTAARMEIWVKVQDGQEIYHLQVEQYQQKGGRPE